MRAHGNYNIRSNTANPDNVQLRSKRVGNTGYTEGRHLTPVELLGGSSATGPCANQRGTRFSNKGFLPMSMANYLRLLDWMARQTRAGIEVQHENSLLRCLIDWGISAEISCRLVKDFGL